MTDINATAPSTPIPLKLLFISEDNVRKYADPEGIDQLATNIGAIGVRLDLIVKREGKKYAIVDGGRRYLALKKREEQGLISDNFPVMCKIDESEIDGKELSLATNIMREDMHHADEFEAFRDLADKGNTAAEIAARFGCEERHVMRLLKLARVSPNILQLYRENKVKLEIVEALTLTDDHARQEKLLKDAPKWWGKAEYRNALTVDKLPVTDKLVKYVTEKTYLERGGQVEPDLFVEFGSGKYFLNIPLLKEIAREKLERVRKSAEKLGFKWTIAVIDETDLDIDSAKLKRLRPEQPPLTKAEQKKYDKLKANFDKLYDEWDPEGDEPDGLDKLRRQLQEIDEREGVWSDEQKAIAGVIITIGNDGKSEILAGYVRPEDMPAEKGKPKKAASATKVEDPETAGLSSGLIEELTAQKSAAISAALIGEPQLALAALVYTIASQAFRHGTRESSGMQLSAYDQSFSRVEGSKAHEAIEKARASWDKKLPDEHAKLWQWCLKQKQNVLLDLLAFCTAITVDAVQTKQTRPDSMRLDAADAIADELELDMTKWFTPTAANYFSRVGKDLIAEAIADVKATPAGPAMKKAELARYAEQCVKGKNWLPKPLRVDA